MACLVYIFETYWKTVARSEMQSCIVDRICTMKSIPLGIQENMSVVIPVHFSGALLHF